MSSYTINVLSDTDDKFVLDLLRALENKRIIDLQPKRRNLAIPGDPLTSDELIHEVELAINSKKKYTAEEAKKILQL
jgi:hypothetical protein